MSQPPKQLKDRDWLYEQYVTLNKSASQIGRELGCQQETVSKWLHKFDIQLRPHGQDVSGEKSGLYKKPVSDERKQHIREAVIESYKSGNNKRWTDEKRKEQSVKYSGSGNPRHGAKLSDDQKYRQKETLKNTLRDHPEIKKKISESMKRYHSLHPEAAVQHSQALENYYKSHPEYSEIHSERCKQYYIDHPLTEEERKTRAEYILKYYREHPEARKIHSKLMTICNPASNPDVAKKISDSMKEWHANNSLPVGCGQCCGRYFRSINGNNVWLRSSYETRYAGILNLLNIEWDYELHTFRLPISNSSYKPDFYIPKYNVFVEVKGYISPENRQKMIEFYNAYPNETLLMVYGENIDDIEHEILCKDIDIDVIKFGVLLSDQVKIWNDI